MTSDSLKRAYFNCAVNGGAPWEMATFASYAGKRCTYWWPGMAARLATFDRLNRVQVPKELQ